MSDSEVFDNYADAMKDQGLVAEADYADARVGSDDVSDIDAFYNLKTDKEDKHIIDQAHPFMAVVSPSYDLMNGVVENIRERHNVMVGIALREPRGHLTQHRYVHAKKELVDELVRIGFTLDHNDEHGLMKLADSCSERLVKVAYWWLIPAGVAAVLGGVAAVNKTKPSDQGVLNNIENTLEQIEEARAEVPNLSNVTDNLVNIINQFKSYAMNYESQAQFNMDVDNPTTEDIGALASAPNAIESAKAVEDYVKACKAMIKIMPQFAGVYKAAAKSVNESEWPEWAAKFEDIWEEHLSDNETDDVPKYLMLLAKSCEGAIASIKAIQARSQGLATDLAKEMQNVGGGGSPMAQKPATPQLPSSLMDEPAKAAALKINSIK